MTSVFCLSRTESKTAGKSGIRQTVRLTSTALRQCIFSPILKKLLSFARRVAIGPHNCCTTVEAQRHPGRRTADSEFSASASVLLSHGEHHAAAAAQRGEYAGTVKPLLAAVMQVPLRTLRGFAIYKASCLGIDSRLGTAT